MKQIYKNIIICIIIVISQLRELLPSDYYFEWIINGKIKSVNFICFLFIKHFTTFFLFYCCLKPKNINKDLLLFCLILSFLDMIHFIISSSFGYNDIKILSTIVVFAFLRSKFNKWVV